MQRLLAATWLALALGCGAPDAAVDGGPAPLVCECAAGERCLECYRHLGDCCYGDPTIFGQVARLAENCEREGDCAACCDECAARTCEELRAGHDCPAALPE